MPNNPSSKINFVHQSKNVVSSRSITEAVIVEEKQAVV